MKPPASALAAVLLGSSATVRAAATATNPGRQLQKTKIEMATATMTDDADSVREIATRTAIARAI